MADTSLRDLSKALELQSGGLYYYFDSKDDAVLACAEEAAVQIEERLITPAFKNLTALSRLCRRYGHYAEKFADKLHCDVEEVLPYVYVGITAVSNYMIFGEQE